MCINTQYKSYLMKNENKSILTKSLIKWSIIQI